MSEKNINTSKSVYDDGNIPDVDLPQASTSNSTKTLNKGKYDVEPLPESSRPRKDGPGGD